MVSNGRLPAMLRLLLRISHILGKPNNSLISKDGEIYYISMESTYFPITLYEAHGSIISQAHTYGEEGDPSKEIEATLHVLFVKPTTRAVPPAI